MKNYLVAFLLLSFASMAQKPFGKINPSLPVDTLAASCGSCNFKMAKKGCFLAVKKDDIAYEVKGTGLDDHGDAHATGPERCVVHISPGGKEAPSNSSPGLVASACG